MSEVVWIPCGSVIVQKGSCSLSDSDDISGVKKRGSPVNQLTKQDAEADAAIEQQRKDNLAKKLAVRRESSKKQKEIEQVSAALCWLLSGLSSCVSPLLQAAVRSALLFDSVLAHQTTARHTSDPTQTV